MKTILDLPVTGGCRASAPFAKIGQIEAHVLQFLGLRRSCA
jgi:hypothetical protein